MVQWLGFRLLVLTSTYFGDYTLLSTEDLAANAVVRYWTCSDGITTTRGARPIAGSGRGVQSV